MLWVGPATSQRKLVGRAYADDLAGIAATQQGLQRVVDAVHTHSLRWGWLLNVPKSVAMVFGNRSVCACLGAPELLWGACRLPTADIVKYLGLRLESEGGWAAQQAAGAANGWAALHQWLPVLRSQYLSAASKLLVLRSRIAPCMTYGMELWRPAINGANMTAVLTRATKVISWIHGEASHTAFFKDRSVNQDVMLADLDILSAADHCRMPLVNMRDRPHQRPPQQHTYTMTRWNSALSCQRRMHRTTWELMSGMARTLGTLGACTPARAMRQRCRTASAPPLHQHARRQPWWVR